MSSTEPHVALHCYFCGYIHQIKVADNETMSKEANNLFVGAECEGEQVTICKKHFGGISLSAS